MEDDERRRERFAKTEPDAPSDVVAICLGMV